MKVEIDQKSGFCFGVVNAIKMAEETLKQNKKLYCLGDIVHNDMEISRLEGLGLVSIDHKTFFTLSDCNVLLRAHGEPPSTYEYAKANHIELIDATCPVVLKLQQRVKKAAQKVKGQHGQLVIYGKEGHAEVIGLNGQTGNVALIIEKPEDYVKIDPQKPIVLFSQTTKSIDKFHELGNKLKSFSTDGNVEIHDTICRQVANRVPWMKEFAARFDVVIFVGGQKSSNARFLFEVCQQTNPHSHFISTPEEYKPEWVENVESVGICGATSTPQWLMENVRDQILLH